MSGWDEGQVYFSDPITQVQPRRLGRALCTQMWRAAARNVRRACDMRRHQSQSAALRVSSPPPHTCNFFSRSRCLAFPLPRPLSSPPARGAGRRADCVHELPPWPPALPPATTRRVYLIWNVCTPALGVQEQGGLESPQEAQRQFVEFIRNFRANNAYIYR